MALILTQEIYVEPSRAIGDYDYWIYGFMNKEVRALLADLGCVQCEQPTFDSGRCYYGTNDFMLFQWLRLKAGWRGICVGTQKVPLLPIKNTCWDAIWARHCAQYNVFLRRLTALIFKDAVNNA